ncbi:unnamed protein product, partial [Ectocarpus sp. 12 AP-2014]
GDSKYFTATSTRLQKLSQPIAASSKDDEDKRCRLHLTPSRPPYVATSTLQPCAISRGSLIIFTEIPNLNSNDSHPFGGTVLHHNTGRRSSEGHTRCPATVIPAGLPTTSTSTTNCRSPNRWKQTTATSIFPPTRGGISPKEQSRAAERADRTTTPLLRAHFCNKQRCSRSVQKVKRTISRGRNVILSVG